jgi:hypothetical protein
MKIKVYLIVSIFFGIIACKEDVEDIEKNTDQSGFVVVGRQWDYEYIAEGVSTSVIYTYKVLSDKGEGFYNMQAKIGDFAEHNEFYWFAKNGVFADETMTFPFNTYFTLLPNNPTLNQTWNSPVIDEELGTIKRTVVALSETVTVLAGTFDNCVKIKESVTNDPSIVSFYWVNNDVGIIKRQITSWFDSYDAPREYFQVDIVLKSKNF